TSLAGKRSQKPSPLARKSKTGGAIWEAKPKRRSPRQLNSAQADTPAIMLKQPISVLSGKNLAGHDLHDNHRDVTSEAPAIVSQDTGQTVPGQNCADHVKGDTHFVPVGAGLAFEPCP